LRAGGGCNIKSSWKLTILWKEEIIGFEVVRDR
jgi:hypothetical protein